MIDDAAFLFELLSHKSNPWMKKKHNRSAIRPIDDTRSSFFFSLPVLLHYFIEQVFPLTDLSGVPYCQWGRERTEHFFPRLLMRCTLSPQSRIRFTERDLEGNRTPHPRSDRGMRKSRPKQNRFKLVPGKPVRSVCKLWIEILHDTVQCVYVIDDGVGFQTKIKLKN